MTSLDASLAPPTIPTDLVEVGTYSTATAGFEHGLVVLATGNSYWLVPDEQAHRLLVEPGEADHIRQQLVKYDRESVGWPPVPVVPPVRKMEFVTPVLWVLAVIAAYWAQVLFPEVVGAWQLDRVAMVDHQEWWRIVPALFLHADVGHLVSNLLSGAFVFSAVTTSLGKVRGWLLIAAAGVAGNALAVLSQQAGYRSLGASTAVFGAVGVLTGNALCEARRRPVGHRWRSSTVPLLSGIVVLALYGNGGPNVDVGAHVCGFACGVVAGWFQGLRHNRAD